MILQLALSDQTGELRSALQLFSMTKFVTAIAVLQQVEKGLLELDDASVVERLCPELSKLPICKGYGDDGKAILEQPKNKITLRMLLDHTSGAYDIFEKQNDRSIHR